MGRVTRLIGGLVGLGFAAVGFSDAVSADERPATLARAVETYEKQTQRAREALLGNFDRVLDLLRQKKLRVGIDDRIKMIEVIQSEKKRFADQGLIPWSLPMWSGLADYREAVVTAEARLRRVYDKETKQALRRKKMNEVTRLRNDLASVVAPKVLATWNHRFGKGPRRKVLYSNGRIDSADGKATWSFEKGVLTLVWPGTRAPGGAWKDKCKVSADGLTYAGKNQKGHRVGGEYVMPAADK